MLFDLSMQQKDAADKIGIWFKEQEECLFGKPTDTSIKIAVGADGKRHFEIEDDFDNPILPPSGKMSKPIFRLFGYAGTGKTTTIKAMMEINGLKDAVYFGAYTGKAAMVMRKTGLPAQTIHSMIYQPVPPNRDECDKLSIAIKLCDDPIEKQQLKAQLKEKSGVHFVRRTKSESVLKRARLIVLDECSMVNDVMLGDLLSFNVPMLVLGDPGQLPPIDGEGALTREKPDVMFTEIHRQARGNPIIDFATRARNKIYIPKIQLGNSAHVAQGSLSSEKVLSFDQIICGKNLTKMKLNQRVRGLRGYEGIYPVVGEKLICLKNNAEDGLYNGLMCEVVRVGDMLDTGLQLWIKKETDSEDDDPTLVTALRAHFELYQDKDALESVRWWDRDGVDEFDFGYAITVHKSQGSQWENVLLWDDAMFKGWNVKDRPKWLYTGITRAIETITIAS